MIAKIDGFKDTLVELPESLKSVQSKVTGNETKLIEVSDKVDQHENKFLVTTKKQEEIEKLLNDRIKATSYVTPGLHTGSQGLTIEAV